MAAHYHQVSVTHGVSDRCSEQHEFRQLSSRPRGEDDEQKEDAWDDDLDMAPPVHPIPQMQAAFEESIREAIAPIDHRDADADVDHDEASGTPAAMRRRRLLEAEHDDAAAAAVTRWKQKPGAKHHPFVKLMAQVVFGMHLLKEGQAKSNEEVVLILQGHIDDVDCFLERTAADFDLAIKDIEERIRYLKLPMQHMDVFDTMLDDKKFRTELLNGNEKIEKIIERTAHAMNAAMHDIHMGIRSTKELNTYLTRIERRWSPENRNIAEVFAAMRGNEQGWMSYLRDLRTKGDNLRNNLVVLETVIGEIARHAAAASRRNKCQGRQVSEAPPGSVQNGKSPPPRSKYTRDTPSSHHYKPPGPWLDKPLPQEPNAVANVKQAAMAKPHPVSLDSRFEQPRGAVTAPHRRESARPTASLDTSEARVASSAREPPTGTLPESSGTQEFSNFLRNSGGLRSHPPDVVRDARTAPHHPARSHSQGGAFPPSSLNKHFRRSRGQNTVAMSEPRAPSRTESRNEPLSQSRRTRPESKQPHPSRTQSRDDGSITSMLKHQMPLTRDAFSRRISKSLKNIPTPLSSRSQRQSSTPAPSTVFRSTTDPARHSPTRHQKDMHHQREDIHNHGNEERMTHGTDRRRSAKPEKMAAEEEEEEDEEEEEEEEEDGAEEEEEVKEAPPLRSESRAGGHSLFPPNVDRPLTPLQAATRNNSHGSADGKGFISSSSDSSPQTQHTRTTTATTMTTSHSSNFIKTKRIVGLSRKLFGSSGGGSGHHQQQQQQHHFYDRRGPVNGRGNIMVA